MNNGIGCCCRNNDNDTAFQSDRSGSCGCGGTENNEIGQANTSRCPCGCRRNGERVGFLCCLNNLLGGNSRGDRSGGCGCRRRSNSCGCGCRR